MTETIDGATYRRHALLLGFLTKAEADGIFASNPVRLPGGLALPAAYQTARTARAALGGFQPGTMTPLTLALEPLANEVRERDADTADGTRGPFTGRRPRNLSRVLLTLLRTPDGLSHATTEFFQPHHALDRRCPHRGDRQCDQPYSSRRSCSRSQSVSQRD